MIDFAQTLSEILDSNVGMRAMVIRPLPKPGPLPFGDDLKTLQVPASRHEFLMTN